MSKKHCEICGKELSETVGMDIPFCAECISRANIKNTPDIKNNKGEFFMKEYIKFGFGAYIGWTLAKATRKIIGKALGVKPEKSKNETVESEKD